MFSLLGASALEKKSALSIPWGGVCLLCFRAFWGGDLTSGGFARTTDNVEPRFLYSSLYLLKKGKAHSSLPTVVTLHTGKDHRCRTHDP